jgi:hypothetical protein
MVTETEQIQSLEVRARRRHFCGPFSALDFGIAALAARD